MSQSIPREPQPLKLEDLRVERYTLPGGQVVSRYVRKSDGQPVGLQETLHLQPKLDPPAS